jgi:hypothetical protein
MDMRPCVLHYGKELATFCPYSKTWYEADLKVIEKLIWWRKLEGSLAFRLLHRYC